ncbi:unnamed protein product, partial [Symbiodinium necroappetens]
DDWHSVNARLVAMRTLQYKYPWEHSSRSTFEARRLLAARFAKTDDQMLLAAFKKEAVLSRSIEDAFAGKAMKFFMHHTGAYLKSPISARVSGVASSMELKKRPLWQAPPLPVTHVRALEEFVVDTDDHARATIAGFLLFCIYSSSRFSDAARASGISMDESGGAVVILETGTMHYKTRAKDRQNRMLPLLALGRTLVQPGWGAFWIKHREATGISNHSCLMPALAPSASWLQRPMTAGEGSMWLRELLHLASVSGDLEAFTSHSLKATALSWSAKSGTMTYEERLTQGHHVHPKLGMALLYSRDAMAEITAKVGRIIRAIVSGGFSPDLPRAQRVALAMQRAPEDFAHLPETQPDLVEGDEEARESEGEGSDISDSELLKGLQALNLPPAPDAVRPRIEATFAGNVFMHILTGVMHCEASPGRFKCGRRVTSNVRSLSQGEAQIHVCQQCAAADSGA